MSDRLVLDASKMNVGVCCWKCRHKRHKFSFAVDWQEGDGCPCCWTHDDVEKAKMRKGRPDD